MIMGNQAKKVAEDQIRRVFERVFKMSFRETELELPGDTHHKFDLVSADGAIVVEIRTFASLGPPRRRLTESQVSDLVREVFLLAGVKSAKRRILVLTDEQAFDGFLKTMYAPMAAANGVEIHYMKVGARLPARKAALRPTGVIPYRSYYLARDAHLNVETLAFGGPPIVIPPASYDEKEKGGSHPS